MKRRIQPSDQPTDKPTNQPPNQSTINSQPTTQPTINSQPTNQPTTNSQPTNKPIHPIKTANKTKSANRSPDERLQCQENEYHAKPKYKDRLYTNISSQHSLYLGT